MAARARVYSAKRALASLLLSARRAGAGAGTGTGAGAGPPGGPGAGAGGAGGPLL
jgi:hypothetical protein